MSDNFQNLTSTTRRYDQLLVNIWIAYDVIQFYNLKDQYYSVNSNNNIIKEKKKDSVNYLFIFK